MHRILLSTIVIDASEDAVDETIAFWAAALGATAEPTPMPQYHVLGGASPANRVVVQRTKSGRTGIHLDIHTDDLDAEVARLERNGASVVRSWADHPGSWVVMRDPAGTEFCVVWAMNELRPRADRDDFEARASYVE
jgi:predicted enzyme related to lactoylglutathione lyase